MSDPLPGTHTYDPEVDAAYIYLSYGPVTRTESVTDWLNIDYGEDNSVRGIEILYLTHLMQQKENTP